MTQKPRHFGCGSGSYGYSRGGDGGDGVSVQSYSTLSSSGTITGGAGGSAKQTGCNGGAGLGVSAYSTASNTGIISGGSGGAASAYYGRGGAGGAGVYIGQSNFTNAGKINGGAAGSTPGDKMGQLATNAPGGDGIDAVAAVVTNSGVITGGTGGALPVENGIGGTGGFGVSLIGTTFTNTGTVIGGMGGSAPQTNNGVVVGGSGGSGALVGAGAILVNNKLVDGGAGGTTPLFAALGGNGVIIDGGIFTNAGTVTEGYGGVTGGGSRGSNGDAVTFAGAGTLVAAPGAKFVGKVVSTLTSGSVLELTGTAATALTGIGTQFIGINLISFATGATRSLEGSLGSNGLSATYGGAVIAGFAAHDTLVFDGFTAIPSSTYIFTRADRLILTASGNKYDQIIYSNLAAKDLEVTAGGGKTTITGLATTATTLTSGAAEFVRSGGIATGKVNKGALEKILSGGTVTATTIAGGELDLEVGAKITGTLAFSGTGGLLNIFSATMPTAPIASFVSGDTIELSGISYNNNDGVTVGTAGTVTITAPGSSYKLNIAGAIKGETDFNFEDFMLTKEAAAKPAMTFISPVAALAASGPPGSWAPNEPTPFTLTAFPELPPESTQGLTLFAHTDHPLSYSLDDLKTADKSSMETAIIRHANTSSW